MPKPTNYLRSMLSWLDRSMVPRAKRLRIEQTAALGNKGTLALVAVDDERLLVGVTSGCIEFHALKNKLALDLPVGGTVR
ncbi:MAG TPA: flagellar biosynthetic protein FliO [Terriglobales bacterium]|nr:flagellar biosynthetic protein FliO [Terriglobales bacterium]